MSVSVVNTLTNPAQAVKFAKSVVSTVVFLNAMSNVLLKRDPYNTDLFYSMNGVKTLKDAKAIIKENRNNIYKPYKNFFSFSNDFYNKISNILLLNRNTNKSEKELLNEEEKLKANQKIRGINYKIDEYRQGNTGDCWLLASIESLSNNKRGRDIIKNAINDNNDGTYSVKFKGINKTYTFTKEEIQEKREIDLYSRGDDDVLILEMAFERFRKDVNSNKLILPDNAPDNMTNLSENQQFELDGGNFSQVIYLLTGDKSKFKMNFENNFDKLFKKFEKNPNKYIAVVGFGAQSGFEGCLTAKDIKGNDVVLAKNDSVHCWSIKSSDGKTVTLINPWDSSKEFTISKKELKKYAIAIEYYSLK